ncbi:MAG: hypothetical protein MK207_01885 [Saprospiraceae bacterium]|nr:hypothetical protein [Saprospiraceae bacterium]
MKKAAFLFTIISILFLLTGCPYESDYSIDDQPNTPVDSTLLGAWMGVDFPQIGDEFIYKVFVFNQNEYLVEVIDNKNKESEREFYRAFISNIKGTRIINLQLISGNYDFIFLKYRLEEGILYMSWLNDLYFKDQKVNASDDIQKLIEVNADKVDLFDIENQIKLFRFIEDK